MTSGRVDSSWRAVAVHLGVSSSGAVFAVVGAATSAGTGVPFSLGLLAVFVVYFVWGCALRIRGFVSVEPGVLEYRNAVRRKVVHSSNVASVAVVDRWWTFVAYGQITSLDVSTPTLRIRDAEGGRHTITSTAPFVDRSAAFELVQAWVRDEGLSINR